MDEGVRANVKVSSVLKMSFTRCHTLKSTEIIFYWITKQSQSDPAAG